MATFIGDYACKVDVKGRIILPSAFKKQMPADAQDHFVVRKDIFEKCLVLYSIEDWNRQLEDKEEDESLQQGTQYVSEEFFKGTAELTLDNNNRLLIPRRLMDLIEADRDVVLAGQDGRIEIWAASVYDTIDLPADDFADLAEKLMGGNINESGE